VRAIVARHGGDVTASNAPGGGAMFTMMLPAAGGRKT
jgi:signal transduction histidine kinase